MRVRKWPLIIALFILLASRSLVCANDCFYPAYFNSDTMKLVLPCLSVVGSDLCVNITTEIELKGSILIFHIVSASDGFPLSVMNNRSLIPSLNEKNILKIPVLSVDNDSFLEVKLRLCCVGNGTYGFTVVDAAELSYSEALKVCVNQETEYPLHKNVKATWFYVGERGNVDNGYIPNVSSAWDDIWLWHYGGVDDPYNRTDYRPAKFIPYENPFYVALPYNDLDENGELKASALRIPWFSEELYKRNGSVLKNRWVRIIKGDKVVYAQWEDVGPFGEDDFDYVFGNGSECSNPVNGACIDVSPAVRDYLGLDDVDYVDWQFVDEKDVPDGPWKRTITTTPVTFMDITEITANDTFYWQLQGNLRTDINATIYDVDLFDTPAEVIKELKRSGKKVICYFSAGTYESWRPDVDKFPRDAIGNPLKEWEGERWLDIRNPEIKEIMKARMDLAVEKGCDGIEPDNIDGYRNDTGFSLTYEDQWEYNRFLAIEAKKRGLVIALKNDGEQAANLEPYFDFALVEECFSYGECEKYREFVENGKPVFVVEYDPDLIEEYCPEAERLDYKLIFLSRDLDGSFVYYCP